MRNPIKVFSVQFNDQIAAGGTAGATFILPLNSQESKIRTVTWNWLSRFNATGQVIPPDNNTTQQIWLKIYADSFLPVASLATPTGIPHNFNNGNNITLYLQGHYEFNGFYAQNDLIFQYTQFNKDAANLIDWWLTVIIEVETLIQNNPSSRNTVKFSKLGSTL